MEPTPRLKDVIFALAAAGRVNHPLGRLPLQKVIYLAEVLAPIWGEFAKPSGFSPYKNGPYDSHIQNTVDALVFRGIVEVSTPHFRRLTNIECQYTLTRAGNDLVKRLLVKKNMRDDLELFNEIVTEISRRGWQSVKELVYAEPTYDSARQKGNSGKLRTDNHSSNLSRSFLREMREALRSPSGEPVSRRNLVQLFFEVLEQHASMIRQHGMAHE